MTWGREREIPGGRREEKGVGCGAGPGRAVGRAPVHFFFDTSPNCIVRTIGKSEAGEAPAEPPHLRAPQVDVTED